MSLTFKTIVTNDLKLREVKEKYYLIRMIEGVKREERDSEEIKGKIECLVSKLKL